MMSKWIDVNDYLPECPGRYLIIRKNKSGLIRIYAFNSKNIYSKNKEDHIMRFYHPNGVEDNNVTHWMSLPDLPK